MGPAVLISTKLHVPAARAGHVPRRALIDVLEAPDPGRLALVAAPPGAGKTTLLAEWAATARRDFAWLSLDAQDDDPVQFWTYAIAALRTVVPDIGAGALTALEAPGTDLLASVVPPLINELAQHDRRLVLVLDDLHVIGDERIHRSLELLVERLPAGVQVAIATRTDPPLALGRLRARGELAEIRAGDLRFDDDEAARLLRATAGLELDAGEVGRLQARTEGWAAGIQLAGLSLRGRSGLREAVAAFAGDDRQVVDYLGAEVLERQDPELRRFLRRTAILGRMTAPLCDAVLGATGSAAALESIERANLFLVPLDTTRRWFRYHHLFADLLRHDLARHEPELVAELHARAARWFAGEGLIAEAVPHALASGDTALATELVAEHWETHFNDGRLLTVSRWLAALPPGAVAADPRLWLAGVWTAMDQGDLRTVEGLVGAAGSDAELSAWVPVIGALHRFKSGDVGRARAEAGAAAAADPGGSAFRRTVALCVAGVAAYWAGDPDDADRVLAEARALAESDGNRLAALYTTAYRALVALDRGSVGAAEEHLAAAGAMVAAEPRLEEHFVATLRHLAAGRLALLRKERAGAAAELERALALARRGAAVTELAATLLALAEVRRAARAEGEARRLAAEAEELLASAPDAGTLARRGEPQSLLDEPLSERELAVLRLMPGELSLREIGDALYVSRNTVKSHTRRIFAKLGVGDRDRAVERARELGLL